MTELNVAALKQLIKSNGSGIQGHSISAVEQARVLLAVDALEKQGHSFDSATKVVASVQCISNKTIRSVHSQFIASGELKEPDTSSIGRGNVDHPMHDTGVLNNSAEAE